MARYDVIRVQLLSSPHFNLRAGPVLLSTQKQEQICERKPITYPPGGEL